MMNRREAINALLNGNKVRQTTWHDLTYLFMDSNGSIRDENDHSFNINVLASSGWEIYNEPKPKKKLKFYRRKWTYCSLNNKVITDYNYEESIEKFDKDWGEDYILSPEIEEIEIEVEDK